eukprot:TRINITY_DN51364_c0_g1_i1.p1 TRINITY_DN51364_c0_g1~~TRINITY_DN51364_c0_g1_i1.p1  ORF type:complete len:136 (-),score=21.84 TRINITY_DN51364_c0_g1_i1:81-488(-)
MDDDDEHEEGEKKGNGRGCAVSLNCSVKYGCYYYCPQPPPYRQPNIMRPQQREGEERDKGRQQQHLHYHYPTHKLLASYPVCLLVVPPPLSLWWSFSSLLLLVLSPLLLCWLVDAFGVLGGKMAVPSPPPSSSSR